MTTFEILTNRPLNSRTHYQGHVAFHFYDEGIPLVSAKLDNEPLTINDLSSIEHNMYVLHVPNTVYSLGNSLTLNIGGIRYNIKIEKKSCKSYTIAWLNPKGGIDHYTFYSSKEESVSNSKESILTSSGYKTISSLSNKEYKVYSDMENNKIVNWISEIVSSPKTWMVDNGNIIPISIISEEANTYSDNIYQIEILFKLTTPIILQSL